MSLLIDCLLYLLSFAQCWSPTSNLVTIHQCGMWTPVTLSHVWRFQSGMHHVFYGEASPSSTFFLTPSLIYSGTISLFLYFKPSLGIQLHRHKEETRNAFGFRLSFKIWASILAWFHILPCVFLHIVNSQMLPCCWPLLPLCSSGKKKKLF